MVTIGGLSSLFRFAANWSFAASMLCAQPVLTANCSPPSLTVSWTPDLVHPRLYVRIYPGAKEIPNYVDQYAAGLRYALPSSPGTATFSNMQAGPWQAYLVQDSPYYQSATGAFACAAPVPQPSTGITVAIVGNAAPAVTPCNSPAVLEAASGYCVATFAGVTTLRLNMGDMVVSALGFSSGTLSVQFDVATKAGTGQ